jgi:putative nucleotidyltransferase with HDIG domain
LRAASVLHDIGKLAVPEHIISKPGKLTPEEFEKMKIHPVVGAEILERVQFPFPVVPIVRAHHEKWNGTGYPAGLKGEEIPIGARILSVVDTLDALASDRQYRRALPLAQAMAKIEQDSGRSFDPRIVETLKRRYVEWERKAQSQTRGSIRLSTDVRIERGGGPAAGFASTRPLEITSEQAGPDESLRSLAAACADVHAVFETGSGGQLLDLEESLAVLAVRLKRMLPHDAMAVYFVQEDKLIPRYVSGDNCRMFSALRIPVGQGLSGWVFENRRAILNGNPSVEPGYLNDPNVFSTLRSALAVPLEASAAVIGVLTFYAEGRECFTREDLRLAQAVAPKLARTVEQTIRVRELLNSEIEHANAQA